MLGLGLQQTAYFVQSFRPDKLSEHGSIQDWQYIKNLENSLLRSSPITLIEKNHLFLGFLSNVYLISGVNGQ